LKSGKIWQIDADIGIFIWKIEIESRFAKIKKWLKAAYISKK